MANGEQPIRQAIAKPPEPAPRAAASSDPQLAPAPTAITPEYVQAEQVLQKLDKPDVLTLAAFFSSKMTLGPDPESAKLMAQTEMHHESCRLEGYKENLKHQDLEGERKHEFRKKRLNHETFLLTAVLLGAFRSGWNRPLDDNQP